MEAISWYRKQKTGSFVGTVTSRCHCYAYLVHILFSGKVHFLSCAFLVKFLSINAWERQRNVLAINRSAQWRRFGSSPLVIGETIVYLFCVEMSSNWMSCVSKQPSLCPLIGTFGSRPSSNVRVLPPSAFFSMCSKLLLPWAKRRKRFLNYEYRIEYSVRDVRLTSIQTTDSKTLWNCLVIHFVRFEDFALSLLFLSWKPICK